MPGDRFSWLIGLALLFLSSALLAYSPDDGFVADANNSVRALAIQQDRKIIMGDLFTTIAGQPRIRIARLEASCREARETSEPDPTFRSKATRPAHVGNFLHVVAANSYIARIRSPASWS